MKKFRLITLVLLTALLIGCSSENSVDTTVDNTINEVTSKDETTVDVVETTKPVKAVTINLEDIPNYVGSPYIIINDNMPMFTEDEITSTSYETFSSLDSLGRCGVAMACVGQDIMPTEERGSIGHIRPSGWQTVKYDNVDGKYLYNRCHLIGFQLTGENDNEKNLITGTRYFNVDGMLPFENLVADYVKETGNHIMYRVTPLYKEDELVARGVLMEGYSVEDEGAGVSFNVFCYNAQPGIEINYANGESKLVGEIETEPEPETTKKKVSNASSTEYVLNMNSYKFHYPSCFSVDQMSESNKGYYEGSRDDLISEGYEPCGNCNP